MDDDGDVRDLTIRSFGILQARAMPPVEVTHRRPATGVPVNGSDAVFAAVAAAAGWPTAWCPTWPTGRGSESRRR